MLGILLDVTYAKSSVILEKCSGKWREILWNRRWLFSVICWCKHSTMPSNIPVQRRRSGSDSEGVAERQRRSWRASWRHSWAPGPSQRRVNFAQWRSKLFDKMPDQTFDITVMQIFSFVLLILIIMTRILRFVAVVCIFIWIKLMKVCECIVYIFRRVFSAEPDKINQNADYTHIEGKWHFLNIKFNNFFMFSSYQLVTIDSPLWYLFCKCLCSFKEYTHKNRKGVIQWVKIIFFNYMNLITLYSHLQTWPNFPFNSLDLSCWPEFTMYYLVSICGKDWWERGMSVYNDTLKVIISIQLHCN